MVIVQHHVNICRKYTTLKEWNPGWSYSVYTW